MCTGKTSCGGLRHKYCTQLAGLLLAAAVADAVVAAVFVDAVIVGDVGAAAGGPPRRLSLPTPLLPVSSCPLSVDGTQNYPKLVSPRSLHIE